MVLSLSTTFLVLILVVVAFGGFVKGVAGFGYGIAGTAILSAVVEPSVAVVIMIIPMLAASLSLVGEIEPSEFRNCVERFAVYIVAAVVGTAAGMFALGIVPVASLKIGIGVVTLVYAVLRQEMFSVPGRESVEEICFTEGSFMKAVLGITSGVLFGATNVGVQVVAYLDSLDLDRSTFVGVLSMVLVGISAARVGFAWFLGLYGSSDLILVSGVAAVPGLGGVFLGSYVRRRLPDSFCENTVVALLFIVGVNLVLRGTGLV